MLDMTFSMKELEYFLLILIRVSCFASTAPFFSMDHVPQRVKIGVSAVISILLYYATMPHVYPEYDTLLGYSIIVVKEAIVGLLIGFSAQICTSIILFSGRLIDMDIGLSMASQMDPQTRENTTITGVLYQQGTWLIMLVSGLHRFLIKALAETYTLIPVNGVHIQTGKLLETLISFLDDYMIIGFLIGMPVFAAITLTNIVLGLLAKLAPQMNMFSVGIQIKLLAGLIVVALTISMLPIATDLIVDQIQKMMVAVTEGLM